MALVLEFPKGNSRVVRGEFSFGCLGADPQVAVASIIYEFMLEKHDSCGGDLFKIRKFVWSHDKVVASCWSRLSKYEAASTKYRREAGLQPFNWCSEDRDSIRSVLRRKPKAQIGPLSPEQSAARFERLQERLAISQMWRFKFRAKPEVVFVDGFPTGTAPVEFYRDAVARGVDPASSLKRPGFRPNEKCSTAEPLTFVHFDVARKYIESGVFDSVRNTKVK